MKTKDKKEEEAAIKLQAYHLQQKFDRTRRDGGAVDLWVWGPAGRREVLTDDEKELVVCALRSFGSYFTADYRSPSNFQN
jgi:hypothetical protein